jgi:hypothetical protein
MEYKTTATAGASAAFKEATCIHTRKIYDSCKERDITCYKSMLFRFHSFLNSSPSMVV